MIDYSLRMAEFMVMHKEDFEIENSDDMAGMAMGIEIGLRMTFVDPEFARMFSDAITNDRVDVSEPEVCDAIARDMIEYIKR